MSSPEPSTNSDCDVDLSLSDSDIGSSEIHSLQETSYGRSMALLNDIIASLRSCGAEKVVDLPTIAVIGNQSSGKSSLIEAISEIKVPRSNTTCTRCPMEVILRRGSGENGEWTCRISLRKDHNDVGEKVGDSEYLFFADTKVKEEVTDLLRGAQLAILNPNKDPSFFCRDNLDYMDDTSLKFSWNTVVMDITGHSVDITFIDLPGMISSVEKVGSKAKNCS
jgi:GTPase SAR1 family protein